MIYDLLNTIYDLLKIIYYFTFTIYHLNNVNSQKEKLELRLKNFGIEIIKLVRVLPKSEENKIFANQIIRSSTSIGANYAEAIYGQTKQEFFHCLNICRKETNETLYWLEMILLTNPSYNKQIDILILENKELLRIFISSVKTISTKNDK